MTGVVSGVIKSWPLFRRCPAKEAISPFRTVSLYYGLQIPIREAQAVFSLTIDLYCRNRPCISGGAVRTMAIKRNTLMITNKNIISNTGEIRVIKTSRGMTLQAFNFTQNRYVGMGSVSGAVYEKGNCPLLNAPKGTYDPSISLTEKELKAARDQGATFLRCITPEKVTYSISLIDFEKHSQPYTNRFYGDQVYVSVDNFVKTGKCKKRNKVLDNPPVEVGEGYQRPGQMSLFDETIKFDANGNYRGK